MAGLKHHSLKYLGFHCRLQGRHFGRINLAATRTCTYVLKAL